MEAHNGKKRELISESWGNGMEWRQIFLKIPFLATSRCKSLKGMDTKKNEIQKSFNSIYVWIQNSYDATRHNFQSKKYEDISASSSAALDYTEPPPSTHLPSHHSVCCIRNKCVTRTFFFCHTKALPHLEDNPCHRETCNMCGSLF